MPLQRKRVPSQPLNGPNPSFIIERKPVGNGVRRPEIITIPTDEPNDMILVDKTRDLSIHPPPQSPPPDLTGESDLLQSPMTMTSSKDLVQSPPILTGIIDGLSTPSSLTANDGFFNSPTSMTRPEFSESREASLNSSIHTPASVPSSATSVSSPTADRSIWTKSIEGVTHFAGGLISHPFESTKHFTMLRHSHGLIYYKGPSTSVAITIFSQNPLPPDRRLWLQMKGWSGKTGMRAKALLRTNSSWINVTPSTQVEASHLPQADNRAWERDIKKFMTKRPKQLMKHIPRETAILRIPSEAVDGYWVVVLTNGENKTRMCRSPVFRVASTSMSASSIKGASLRSLPIELGINLMQRVVVSAAGNAVMPLGNTVRQQVQPYVPSFWMQEAGSLAYSATGVDDKIGSVDEQYDRSRETDDQIAVGMLDEFERADVIGPDTGPEHPFPIRLHGKVIRGTGRSRAELGMPTANISGVPEATIARLSGVYFGWASIMTPKKVSKEKNQSIKKPKKQEKEQALEEDDDFETFTNTEETLIGWKPALIMAAPDPYIPPAIVPKKTLRAYIIDSLPDPPFYDAKISLLLMGVIHASLEHPLSPTLSFTPLTPSTPNPQSPREIFLSSTYRDIAITQATLDREAWDPDVMLDKISSRKSERSITERYVNVRREVERHVDKVPLHYAGIRTPSASFAAKDRLLGPGGLWVAR